MHRIGHWLRQRGCVYSQVCADCRATDTQQDALQRQTVAAGPAHAQPRRMVVSFNGDMKGLMQILRLAGANGTYNCMFCLAHANQTNVAGLPCLRHPPDAWKASPLFYNRPAEAIDTHKSWWWSGSEVWQGLMRMRWRLR